MNRKVTVYAVEKVLSHSARSVSQSEPPSDLYFFLCDFFDFFLPLLYFFLFFLAFLHSFLVPQLFGSYEPLYDLGGLTSFGPLNGIRKIIWKNFVLQYIEFKNRRTKSFWPVCQYILTCWKQFFSESRQKNGRVFLQNFMIC